MWVKCSKHARCHDAKKGPGPDVLDTTVGSSSKLLGGVESELVLPSLQDTRKDGQVSTVILRRVKTEDMFVLILRFHHKNSGRIFKNLLCI